jgi:hypothetical protein
MYMRRSTPVLLMAFFLIAGGLLAACGGAVQNSQASDAPQPAPQQQAIRTAERQATDTSSSQIDRAIPPVILSAPSPAQLEAYFSVTMGGYDPATRAMTIIGLGFTSNGRPVQFAGSEQLQCNGIALPLHNQTAEFQIAEASTSTLEGHTLSCTYSTKDSSATLELAVPYAPLILSPQDNAQLPRSTHTVVTYNVQDGQILGVVALGSGVKTIAGSGTLDMADSTMLNTSAFPTGAGIISLTQVLELQVTQTGTSFKSLSAEGMAETMVPVTWV